MEKKKKITKKNNKKPNEKKKKLTEKEKMFCQIYIKNFNATMAVIKAGFEVKDTNSASCIGYQLLQKTTVREEITRLKEEKKKALLIDEDDIVERFMRIAFADMTDFVEFGQEEVPVMTMFGPVKQVNPITGIEETVKKKVNCLKLKESALVDGGLVCQIKQSKDGASIKLEDRQRALEWLADYFDMNPMNRHRREYDKRKLEIELIKAEAALNKTNDSPDEVVGNDGFIEALNASAEEVWDNVNDSENNELDED